MSDIFADVLLNYLTEAEWGENVEVFVSSNCPAFKNVVDHNHGKLHQFYYISEYFRRQDMHELERFFICAFEILDLSSCVWLNFTDVF